MLNLRKAVHAPDRRRTCGDSMSSIAEVFCADRRNSPCKSVNRFGSSLSSHWNFRLKRHNIGRNRLQRSPMPRKNQPSSDERPRLHLADHRLPPLALGRGGIAVTQWRAMATRRTARSELQTFRVRALEAPQSKPCPYDAPHLKCTCGIYASKRLEHLHRPGYQRSLIYGQVLLWGTIVEHQRGWRAQYAYPQSFLLPPEVLPVRLMEIESRLKSLISYDRDIFILQHGAMFPLWKNDSGFAATGLDYLTDRASKWYTQRNQGSWIKQGTELL